MATIEDTVKLKYGAVATSDLSGASAGVNAVAEAFGYTKDELGSIPAEANMGLSCGNPTAFASLRRGEVVVDLGCGGGIDVLLAAEKVGPTGRAIGIDITPAMLDRARSNAAKSGVTNVEFHLARMDSLPLPDASVDVVISNCVINLAEDKPKVFREIFRVLKPGGRVAVSDIALKRELPVEVAHSVEAFVGCIAGAILVDAYRSGLKSAGFEQVDVIDSNADLNAYASVEGQSGCCSPAMEVEPPAISKGKSLTLAMTGCCAGKPAETSVHDDLQTLLQRFDINAYAASVKVFAIKPA